MIRMLNCPRCQGRNVRKAGFTKGKQRYKCKSCGVRFSNGDARMNHSFEKRLKVIKMYLEGMGIRSIERAEGVLGALIVYWIRHFQS